MFPNIFQIMVGGVHRTPVVDEADHVQFCFSQSDVVKILAGSIDKGHLHPLGLKTLGELGLGQQGVISVGTEATVLSAMKSLQSNSISALAIIHDNGTLAGNFSTSDLKVHFLWHCSMSGSVHGAGPRPPEHRQGLP